MKIVVCIKQVPDTKGGVQFNPDGTLNRAAMLAIMNPDDKAGLEAALRLKDKYGAEVTVLTMGLPKAADLIITGRQAIDGDTAQVGPQISEHLGIPVISYAQKLEVDGDSIVVERQYEDRYHVVKAKMPCLVTALAELNEPRYMTPGGIFDAFQAEITTWGRADLKDLDDANIGLKGSPTKIAKASDKVRKGAGEMFTLDPEAAAAYITEKLQEKHII